MKGLPQTTILTLLTSILLTSPVAFAQEQILVDLTGPSGGPLLAFEPDGNGGYFAAGVFEVPGGLQTRVVHVDSNGDSMWGPNGYATPGTIPNPYLDSGSVDIALTADGENVLGGVWVTTTYTYDTTPFPAYTDDQTGLIVAHVNILGAIEIIRFENNDPDAIAYGGHVETATDGTNGVWVVLSSTPRSRPGELQLYAARVLTDGTLGAAAPVSEYLGRPGFAALVDFDVEADGANGILVMYSGQYKNCDGICSPPMSRGVWAQHVDSGSNVWSARGIELVNGMSSDVDAVVDDGSLYGVWSENGIAWAQKFTLGGILQWGFVGVVLQQSASSSSWNLTACGDGQGGLIVSQGRQVISVQRANASGTLLWGPNGVAAASRFTLPGSGASWTDIQIAAGPNGDVAVVFTDKAQHHESPFPIIPLVRTAILDAQTGSQKRTGVAWGYEGAANGVPVVWHETGQPRFVWSGDMLEMVAVRTPAYVGGTFVERMSWLAVDPISAAIPSVASFIRLDDPFPNPANPRTTIRFEVTDAQSVDLTIYDSKGRFVRKLILAEAFAAGEYTRVWDGSDDAGRGVASGVYFVRVVAGNQEQTKRVTLVR